MNVLSARPRVICFLGVLLLFGAVTSAEFLSAQGLASQNRARTAVNPSSVGTNDPSASEFGCACETPDVANTNPVLGSGAAGEIQLGLRMLF